MKRIVLSVISMLLFFAVMQTVLIYEPEETYDKDATKFVAILNPGSSYWAWVKEGIEQADEDLGTFTKYSTFNRFDTQEQIRLLEKTEYMDIDGIITVGEPASEEVNALLQKRREEGIPVVLVDTDSDEKSRDCYIGSDNYLAGVLAAQRILEETGGVGEAAVMVSGLKTGNQKERLDGFRDTIESTAMELVAVKEHQKDKHIIQENFKQILAEYPDLKAVFCAEATSSNQIGLLLSGRKEQDLTVVCFDNTDVVVQSVKEGSVSATIIQNSFDMGYEAVKTLCELQEEAHQVPDKIYTEVVCATGETIEQLLNE